MVEQLLRLCEYIQYQYRRFRIMIIHQDTSCVTMLCTSCIIPFVTDDRLVVNLLQYRSGSSRNQEVHNVYKSRFVKRNVFLLCV